MTILYLRSILFVQEFRGDFLEKQRKKITKKKEKTATKSTLFTTRELRVSILVFEKEDRNDK